MKTKSRNLHFFQAALSNTSVDTLFPAALIPKVQKENVLTKSGLEVFQ
jgi:hypothetical protein